MSCNYRHVYTDEVSNAAKVGNCIMEKLALFKMLSALLQCSYIYSVLEDELGACS